jgi:hypothetical protein
MMTDAFKSIEQGLKEAIANGATTHHVVIDLVQATEYIKELEANLAMAVEALEYYNDTLMIPTNLRAFDILAKLKGEI